MQNIATLRLIESHELHSVSGGTDEIVVIGSPPTNSIDIADYLQFRNAFDASQFGSLSGLMGGGGGGSAASDLVDTDGDGVPDSPPIVVTATQHQVVAAQVAFDMAEWVVFGWEIALGGGALASGLSWSAFGYLSAQQALSNGHDAAVAMVAEHIYRDHMNQPGHGYNVP